MSTPGWRLDDLDGIRLIRCEALESVSGTSHAFSTRLAHGRSDFDLGPAGDVSDTVRSRRLAFLRAAGVGDAEPCILQQVHGGRIIDTAERTERPPQADGAYRLTTASRGTPVPAVRTADCVAILIVDRESRAVAAVHAGWRGSAKAIAVNAVAALGAHGIAPADLLVAMGPAIQGCCYEVGEEVVTAVSGGCPPGSFAGGRGADGQVTVDLHAANRAQLIAAGVPAASVHAAPWCTRCRNDLFYSVRAEGASAGRLMAVVGPRVAP